MRLAVIGPTYPYKGGISHFTTLLVRHLRKFHEVQFLSWKRQYPGFLYPVEPKDTESKFPIKENADFSLDYLNPLSWMNSYLKIINFKADRLIFTWVTPLQSPIYTVILLLLKFTSKLKIMYICHNVLPHEQSLFDRLLTKMAFTFADEFVVHSKEDRQILEKIVTSKIIIDSFHPVYDIFNQQKKYDIRKIKEKLKLKKKVLLFFGYIRPYKGLRYLIRALPEILKSLPDVSLLVVGEFWKDKNSYFELVDKLDLRGDVVFVDHYVPNEEVETYFHIADVVVLPYISATQSGIVQIAYAFDKPVISTTVGGLKDIIIDKKTGYLIRPQDIKDISAKVKLFYKFGIDNNNIRRVKKNYSWTAYINKLQLHEK